VDGRFQEVPAAGKIGRQIFALFQGRDGLLWVGGENGLGSYDGHNWKLFSARDGLPPNAVRALADDDRGNLWIGTEGGGLFMLRDGKISAANAPVKDISALLVDRDGVLWAGTSGHGLARLAQGHWTTCAASDGLAGDDIGYLLGDDWGNLWLGSYEGLMRVGEKSLADFAADRRRKISCRTFLTRECSAGAQPAALRTHEGKLLFPTTAGLMALAPGDLLPNTNPPPVVIESVAIDGVPQKNNPLSSVWPGTVTLAPENEKLEIHFTALDFSAPKRAQLAVQFKFQLEGRDKNPTDAGGERVAHFSRLAPGHYVFRVRAGNEDGVWNDAGATLTVIVEPPFWRQPWFVATTLLFLLGALAGIIYLISTAKLKRELRGLHQKELLEKERARIARDLHDQLGANLTQVTLLGEMAEADKALPGEVEQHAQQICATARETTRALDEIVWAVNPANDTLEGLVNYACKYAQDYFALAGVSYRAELPTQLPPTPILPEVRHNVFLAFKEAVNNIVKHSQATEARVKLQLEPDKFILTVADNGRGLGDLSAKQLRNGLKNMRKRLSDVHGEFEIKPGANGGTVVRLTVPLNPE
jgi:signal transduction histidine kinase